MDDRRDDTGTAVGYLTHVFRYLEGGGRLSSVDATVSEALRMHARELGADGSTPPVPGSLKAAILRESVEEMVHRHNNLQADAVFRDMEEQARKFGSGSQ